MQDVDILGQTVVVSIDKSLVDKLKQEKGLANVAAMAKVINDAKTKLQPIEIKAFQEIKHLVLFESKKFEGLTMTRSFMDQKTSTFCFEIDEFLAEFQTPQRLATYYFHDAWHIVQFEESGDHHAHGEEAVDREVDATLRQIEVGKRLGCDTALLDFLAEYAADRADIKDRIASGIST